MGAIDQIKEWYSGRAPPEISSGLQGCEICHDVNKEVERHGAPAKEKVGFEDGDEVIFYASSNREADSFVEPLGIYHRRHAEEYGQRMQLKHTAGEERAIVAATLRQTGYDYGKQMQEALGGEYEEDYDPNALTYSDVRVMAYSAPDWGVPDGGTSTRSDDSDHSTPLQLKPTWPEEKQQEIYQYIKRHS